MLSAKHIPHALEKLDASRFGEVFRITDTIHFAQLPQQVVAIAPHLLGSWSPEQESCCFSNMLSSSQVFGSHRTLHGCECGGFKYPFAIME